MGRAMLRSVLTVVVGIALALLVGATPARAYRPFDFEDAAVPPIHACEIQLGPAEYVSAPDERFLHAPSFGLSYGFGKGFELGFSGVNRVAIDPSGASKFEDWGVSAKQVFREGSLQDTTGWSIASEAEVEFPSNGATHPGVSLTGIASASTPSGMFHLDVEASRTTESESGLGGGVIFELGDENTVAPVVQLGLAGETHATPEASALVGVIYVPDERLEFDVAARFVWSGGEQTTELRAGVTHQISVYRVMGHARHVIPYPHHRRRH